MKYRILVMVSPRRGDFFSAILTVNSLEAALRIVASLSFKDMSHDGSSYLTWQWKTINKSRLKKI